MNEVSAVQHEPAAFDLLGRLWHDLTGRPAGFAEEEIAARREILQRGFEAQLGAVTAALHRLARADSRTRDISAAAIRRGLLALLSHFPVYRGYDAGSKRSAMDQTAFSRALDAAKAESPASAHPVLDRLDRWLGGEDGTRENFRQRQIAGTRFQQLSAPVAAKAVEDTAFYRYGRLLSRNDVGFDAGAAGMSVAAFHAACAARLAGFPDAMLATATHDHKRGEDVRARLAVISEVPEAWATFATSCLGMPTSGTGPDAADILMLYQTLIGAWPLDLDVSDQAGCDAFKDRLAAWQQKALREAKLRTDWTAPDQDYEAAAAAFLDGLFDRSGGFLPAAWDFIGRIAPAGAVNGLSQAVLKMTVPGMPDFFQGTEFWDFSLVDPDNRRPVDFDCRKDALSAGTEPIRLLHSWRDGRIKQAVVRSLLGLRRQAPALFARGAYLPLTVRGALADRLIAFARIDDEAAIVVVVPRLVSGLLEGGGQLHISRTVLHDIIIEFPPPLRGRMMRTLFDGSDVVMTRDELRLDVLLADFPVAVLHGIESA